MLVGMGGDDVIHGGGGDDYVGGGEGDDLVTTAMEYARD
jgi:RTX calcium-binding nonapeptide repeat (4 copies)